jgi:EAL domain-containing protein (putative c-di-GMP-specific phosphodiesterase class I)
LDHLENISERIWIGIEEELFKLLYPILKENIKVSIGYNLIIKNPMIDNLHLVMQLISDSKKMGEFTLAKRDHIRRYTLQKIIINQEIYSVFQPIVDLRDLNIIGYEALSRGPKGTEYASPQMLFALALECGLSFELDRLCRKKAFESAQHIKTNSKIFVNTLATTIHDPEFRGYYLKELLEDLKIKPENVVFEISEKMAIENYDMFRTALKDYNDIGIIHADDDLGKGYSDLERVMELNPGYLKVDISLVKDIDKSFIKQEIMKAMSNLAQNIGSKIVAEGIETKSEYEMLMSLGIKYGQGFLFARPSEDLDSIQKNFIKI